MNITEHFNKYIVTIEIGYQKGRKSEETIQGPRGQVAMTYIYHVSEGYKLC